MNKYLIKVAETIDMEQGPRGVWGAKPPKPAGLPSTIVGNSMPKKAPGLLSRIGSRIAGMSTVGKIGLGIGAGVLGTKALSSNNNNN